MYNQRTKYIESLIYSDRVNEEVTDEEKRLLQNGFIPDEYIKNSPSTSDSIIEPLIFGNYFYENPEKICGTIIPGSGYINPVKVKGDINDVIKSLNTMKHNPNVGYKGFAKVNQAAKRNIKNLKNNPTVSVTTEIEHDIILSFDSKEEAKEFHKLALGKIGGLNFSIEQLGEHEAFGYQDKYFSNESNITIIEDLYGDFLDNKIQPNISPANDLLNNEPQKEVVSVETVPSIIQDADLIINADLSDDKKTYTTVEESVKFLNPGISDDELKAWVWYKRLHGNHMKGWEKWFIESETDDKTKLIFASEETELLGNNYKPIGFVPKDSIVGLKTKFSNTYGTITYIVCKTPQGNLVWVNEAHTFEKSTINTKGDTELDRLVKEGALIYTGDEYMPIPIFLFGNFYHKIKELEANKEVIITRFGEDVFNNTLAILDKFKPKQKSFSDPVPGKRPFISCLSEFAINVDIFGIKALNEELNIKLGEIKRNRFHEITENISLFDAFQYYLSQYVKDTDIKKTNKVNIKNYYFAKAVKWPKDNEGKDTLNESQKAELIGNARFEAERLFSDFMATGLLVEDRMKLDHEWNIRYNAMSNINNFVHKVPIGYEGSAMFKLAKLIIKPAQREGLAYLSIIGAGCLAYEVGFGKTAIAILNIAQLISQGSIKRSLIIVPKPTYKNWLKELFGYYSDGEKNELYEFEGAKYYYGILSGTKIILNDWYNLKGKTLSRLTAIYGSEEKINSLLPENSITIVTYQGFEQIGFSRSISEKVFDSIYEALSQRKNIEVDDREDAKEYQKIRELMGIAQRNTIVDIDKLGIDHITVDEAHNFKNAFSSCGKDPSTGRKLFGIQANRSNRAVKMFFHTQYIQRFYGKSVVLLTATPFTNSPLEWFSMISYVGLDTLLNYNLWSIQKFFEQFVMQTVEYSVDAKGELKVKPVIKAIQNLGLFQTILFNCFHRKDDPKEAGITRPCLYEIPNNEISTFLDMNEYQLKNQADVRLLVNSYSKENKGAILKALSLSQNNAFSPFLAAKEQPQDAADFIENSPKLNYIANCILSVKEYHESRGEECSGQIIYSNRGVEYFHFIKEYLQDYVGFKTGLIFDDEKIDEVEIITGGGAEKDEDWKELVKEAFNAGVVKVIIGTGTIKEGINLQTRGTCIYLALPEYNPSDIQQLKGRIWRQGNMYGYCRFVVPLIVNSMDAFIWQKIDEKTARLGSIWVKTESNVSEMTSELSPEEIKYSLVESVDEKLKIKRDSELSKAEYDFNLAEENLNILDSVNYEISELKEYISKAKTIFMEKIPKWTILLDIIIKKVLPVIELSDSEEKAKVKKKFNDLRDKINDLIVQFNICRDTDWNSPREILTLIRYLEQRMYDLPAYYDTGLVKQVSEPIISENFGYSLFAFDSYTKRKIVEHWSTIAKSERSVFQPYGKTWSDDTEELRATLKKIVDETKLYLEYINSDSFSNELIAKITKEIEQAQLKRGTVKDRVDQFKSTNHLLSYLKDNTDLENCPIPANECCDMNIIEVEEKPDVYNEVIVYEKEMPRIIDKNEEKAVRDEIDTLQEYNDIIFTYQELLTEILAPGERQEYEDIIFTYKELLNELNYAEPVIESLKLSDIPPVLKNFIPDMQQKAIVGSVEHYDILDRLKNTIENMPSTYETEDIDTDEKIVYLHYFYSDSDWYIVEKDKGQSEAKEKKAGLEYGKQYQAFGYAILNGDLAYAEWGYISIQELIETNKVELDFYWEPKKFKDINF